MKKSLALGSVICNLLIVAFCLIALAPDMLGFVHSEMGTGIQPLRYFTIDSNILLAIAAILCLPSAFASLKNPGKLFPTAILRFKHIATAAVMLTFLVSICWLLPTKGAETVIGGRVALLHVANPLLALVSFCVFERGIAFSGKASLFGLIPLAVYGVFYVVMVCVIGEANGGWPDLYGFASTMIVASAVLIVLQAGICLGLWVPHKLLNWKNRSQRPL